MARPVIGITIELEDPLIREVEQALREPLERAGALVLVLPRATAAHELEAVLELVDGVQFSGGADVDPAYYDAERHALTEIVPASHDAFEIGLARAALDRGMPVLGVCRGAQVVAVADGGALTQDVETLHAGAHRHGNDWPALAMEPPGEHWHDVDVVPGSNAERWFAGGPYRVNSFHHQAVAVPGRRLAATVRSRDGVIEAVERVDGMGFAVGLQWHNELMWRVDERFLAPHLELVEAAARVRPNGTAVRLRTHL